MNVVIDRTWLVIGLLGMALLTWFNGRPEAAGLLPAPWDKLAHGLIFGALALLFGMAMGGRYRLFVWLLLVAFSAFDELRQAWLPGRSASWGDFLVDVSVVVLVLWLFFPRVRL